MKYFYNILLLLCAAFLLCKCGNKDRAGHELTEVRTIQLKTSSSIAKEDFFNNPSFIPLDTLGGGTIGSVGKVVFHDNSFYILDVIGNSVLVFNEEGEFLKKIGNPGDGPATINIIYDFHINQYTGMIELLSPDGVIVAYDYEKDEYSDLFTLNGKLPSINFMCILTEDITVFYSKFSDYRLNYYSRSSGKIVLQELENNYRNEVNMVHISPFPYGNENKRYVDYYSGYIYDITESGIVQTDEVTNGVNPVSVEVIPSDVVDPGMVKNFLSSGDVMYPIVNYAEYGLKRNFLVLMSGVFFQLITCTAEDNSCKNIGEKFNVPMIPFATKSEDGIIGVIYNYTHLKGFFPKSISSAKENEIATRIGENPILFKYN